MNLFLPLMGLLAGFCIVYKLNVVVPIIYANYLAVAVLATLDSVVGGVRAGMDHRFESDIFFSGFFINAIAAGILSYFGDQIGVPLTLVATIVFGYRIFQNLSLIRTHWIVAHRRGGGRTAEAVAISDPAVNGTGSPTPRGFD